MKKVDTATDSGNVPGYPATHQAVQSRSFSKYSFLSAAFLKFSQRALRLPTEAYKNVHLFFSKKRKKDFYEWCPYFHFRMQSSRNLHEFLSFCKNWPPCAGCTVKHIFVF